MRIGVLTGGGDCPGLNAVIRAVVKKAIGDHNMEVFGIRDGFKGLVENDLISLDIRDVVGILPKGGTLLGTTNRDNPFHYGEKINGKTVYRDRSDTVLEVLAGNKIDVLIVIGGDGTLTIAKELYEKGVQVVGVPKTIDNDLSATDVTFGFDTAVTTAVDAIDKLHTTAESHHRVMVLELMGRDAGWIALHAGVAGGADVILIPEIPFQIEAVCNKIRERNRRGRSFSIVVAAEGAYPQDGEQVTAGVNKGNIYNPRKLGGIGLYVGRQIEFYSGHETRVTVLGHLQRGGSPTAFDRLLATRYGTAAVEAIVEKQWGNMVCLRGQEIQTVLLSEAVKRIKRVPKKGELVRSAQSLGISFGV